MPAYLLTELIEPSRQVPVGEKFTLRMTVTCPPDRSFAMAIRSLQTSNQKRVGLDTSMIPRELILQPGEVCTLAVDVTFHDAGLQDTNLIEMQIDPVNGPDHLRKVLSLPSHQIRVVPSLTKVLDVSVARICQYGAAVKLEIAMKYYGEHELKDVEWTMGPENQVRSGVTRRRFPLMKQVARFCDEMVMLGSEIDINFAATCQGERIQIQRTLKIPEKAEIDQAIPEFRFLEPRNFTKDTITIKPEKEVLEVVSKGGIFPVFGGKSRYDVTILPTNSNATNVTLLPAAGRVEVSNVAKDGRASRFIITVLDNPTLRQTVRLDYTFMIDGQPSQGEIYLSIRPTNSKLWMVAFTAGVALTAKGLLGFGPALFRPETGDSGFFEHISDLFDKRWTDLVQMASIPFIRAGLWLTDVVMRQFDDV